MTRRSGPSSAKIVEDALRVTFCPVMPGFWGFFSFFFEVLKRETAGVGAGKGSWAMGRGFVASFCPDLPGFSDIWWLRAG